MGSPKLIMVSSVSLTSNRITWEEVDCHLRNGRIIEYIVIISNNSMIYNLTSSERYIIVNDLVFGNVYNMSVASVNTIGRGPFSDPVEVQIGTSKYFVCSCEQQLYFVLCTQLLVQLVHYPVRCLLHGLLSHGVYLVIFL